MGSREDALASIARRRAIDDPIHGIWAITQGADGRVVGNLLLKPIPVSAGEPSGGPTEVEIGWHLHPEAWGHGYATEAAAAVLDDASSRGLAKVLAVTHPDNHASLHRARVGSMGKFVDHIEVLHPPETIPLEFELGSCAIALTTNPFVMPPVIRTQCYAVLGDWLPPTAPVGMIVTFTVYNPAGGSSTAIEVHNVYAVEQMRGHANAEGDTIPVRIGKWLFAEGYLTLHSPDRTDAGDRWARRAGGPRPPRDERGTAANAELNGQLAVDRLNDEAWPAPPWPRRD